MREGEREGGRQVEEVLVGKGKWMLSEFWRTFQIRRQRRRVDRRSGRGVGFGSKAEREKEGQRERQKG